MAFAKSVSFVCLCRFHSTPAQLVHFQLSQVSIRHWADIAEKENSSGGNIVIVEVHFSPVYFSRGPHFHDRERARLLTAIGRGPIPGWGWLAPERNWLRSVEY
jgi:hypothetical protein